MDRPRRHISAARPPFWLCSLAPTPPCFGQIDSRVGLWGGVIFRVMRHNSDRQLRNNRAVVSCRFRLNLPQVGCEGYDYPDDPFILKGSCQLVYSLNTPATGRRSWDAGKHPTWDGRDGREAGSFHGADSDGHGIGSRLVTWAVLGVIGYVLYNVFARASGEPTGEYTARFRACWRLLAGGNALVCIRLSRHRWGAGEGGGRVPRGCPCVGFVMRSF